MIRINLLPETKRKESREGLYIRLYIIFLFFSIVFCIASALYLKHNESIIDREIKKLTKKINTENMVLVKLKEIKGKQKQVERRIITIVNLQKNRGKIVKTIDKSISYFPINRMYLTKLYVDWDKVDMDGYSADLTTIASYMKRLEASGFKNLTIKKTIMKKINDYNLVNFELEFNH